MRCMAVTSTALHNSHIHHHFTNQLTVQHQQHPHSRHKIIEVWKKSCIVRQFSTLKLYSESEIEAGLRKRLDSHFKNFATYKEIHDFFRDLYPTVQVADTGDYNPLICRICWTNPTKIIFLDCGHACACVSCANDLKKCLLCRSLIKKFQTIFFQ